MSEFGRFGGYWCALPIRGSVSRGLRVYGMQVEGRDPSIRVESGRLSMSRLSWLPPVPIGALEDCVDPWCPVNFGQSLGSEDPFAPDPYEPVPHSHVPLEVAPGPWIGKPFVTHSGASVVGPHSRAWMAPHVGGVPVEVGELGPMIEDRFWLTRAGREALNGPCGCDVRSEAELFEDGMRSAQALGYAGWVAILMLVGLAVWGFMIATGR